MWGTQPYFFRWHWKNFVPATFSALIRYGDDISQACPASSGSKAEAYPRRAGLAFSGTRLPDSTALTAWDAATQSITTMGLTTRNSKLDRAWGAHGLYSGPGQSGLRGDLCPGGRTLRLFSDNGLSGPTAVCCATRLHELRKSACSYTDEPPVMLSGQPDWSVSSHPGASPVSPSPLEDSHFPKLHTRKLLGFGLFIRFLALISPGQPQKPNPICLC